MEIDLEAVTELAADGNSMEMIANVLGINKATISRRKEAHAAFDKGRAELGVNLRHWQMLSAKSGNVQMQIWLGKQYLGQKDQPDEQSRGQLTKVDEIMQKLDEASKA
ncbi:MAG: hypothetical protein SOY94_01385 [Candidatus Limiplasma sp.]|nr:hypothetical protein [Candidatus Limiplasma sp.]